MEKNKGIVHPSLLIIVAVVVAIWAVVGYLVATKFLNISLPGIAPKEPKVELKTQYKNPFDKKAQYVNPFDQFKNPFHNLK